MYRRRLFIFISLSIAAISVCLFRTGYLQLTRKSQARYEIKKDRMLAPRQLPTVRGTIYDRKRRELAVDKPQFYFQINYLLTRLMDSRFWRASIATLASKNEGMTLNQAHQELKEKFKQDEKRLNDAINKCIEILGVSRAEIISEIQKINDQIWKEREFGAWLTTYPDSELVIKFKETGKFPFYDDAMNDFDAKLTAAGKLNPYNERLKIALDKVNAEARQLHPIVEIKTQEQLLEIQFEFVGIKGVEIAPVAERVYKYGPSAAHLVGWVGPADEKDRELFANDIYSQYNPEDFAGKFGTESACEFVLRGRRGEVRYTRNDELLSRKERHIGEDVHLSIDIELQQKIENHLTDRRLYPPEEKVMGAVVIDVATGDILAMVSIPTFDLNTARQKYGELLKSPTNTLKSKALFSEYPPGSVIKPIILTIGLEEGLTTPGRTISCPARPAPEGWPDCIIYRVNRYSHDLRWAGQGGNTARNAIRGSCNIYFSHLADEMEATVLQGWLFRFGFGHKILPQPYYPDLLKELKRDNKTGKVKIPETPGIISSVMPAKPIQSITDIPPLNGYEKRMFGIGQSSLRVTVLQMANAMASLARGGIYKSPNLFLNDKNSNNYQQSYLGVSQKTLDTVLDGMHSVVYEKGGTANKAFEEDIHKFDAREIRIYGKTGSTEKPYNAWFAGFAKDISGRALALAVFVKGGESGSKIAAPKGKNILEICSEMGYIGIDPKRLK